MTTTSDAELGPVFDSVSALPRADNENDPDWVIRRRFRPPVCSNRRVYGSKQTGSPPDFRVVTWETPERPGEYNVGLMMETYIFGTQMRGTPDTALWLHSTHDSEGGALMMLNSLYLNHVFETFRKLIDEKGLKKIAAERRELPFGQPSHWRETVAFNLSVPGPVANPQ